MLNDLDRIAINKFNPDDGDYLVLKGKGDYKHLECRHLRGAKIPFLGRILQKIVYPSFRFEKVIDYISKNEVAQIETLKEKMAQYFRIDDEGEATRHKSLWSKINRQFAACFPDETESEEAPVRNIAVHPLYPEANSKEYNLLCDLPPSLLEQLPPDRSYVIISTMTAESRAGNAWCREDQYPMLQIENHLKTIENPIVLVVFFPDRHGTRGLRGDTEDLSLVNSRLDEMKENGSLIGYCPLFRSMVNYNPETRLEGWKKYENKNRESIQDMISQLEEA
ncbi:MAG: hypothetical protein ACK5MA_08695 [Parachlamydiaceae bacterium]